MQIIDISMTIKENMPVFKNKADKRPLIWMVRDNRRQGLRETRMDIDLHTGTHLDAPLHFFNDGASVDRIDLNKVIAPCLVLDFTDVKECITVEDLRAKKIATGEFVLLKTRNSFEEKFSDTFVYLSSEGAQYLKEMGITGVGIDALRIEREMRKQGTRKVLFESGIVILEGLRLKEVTEGQYHLYALPLKIQGAEASPVRAVLVKEGA